MITGASTFNLNGTLPPDIGLALLIAARAMRSADPKKQAVPLNVVCALLLQSHPDFAPALAAARAQIAERAREADL